MPDRGERGPKGDHGQTGDIGLTGEQGATGRRGATGESSLLSRNVSLSFGVVVAVAILVTSCQGYQLREVRHLAAENRGRIHESEQLRRDLVRGLRIADYRLCVGQELLKDQNRADAIRSFNELDLTLRILKLERTPEIVEVATERRDRVLKRNAPRPGGCGQLPP